MENKNIKVFLRIKPVEEKNPEMKINVSSVELKKKTFGFDKVFLNSSQQDLYSYVAKNFIVECMQGYNCIIFAYGQTGSGKTYTIEGNGLDLGLVPRTLCFLHSFKLKIKISFLEIYNEQILDLFNVNNPVSLREDPFKGVYVENLTEIASSSYDESIKNYERATFTRKVCSTDMNDKSSRSHCIFIVNIENTEDPLKKESKMVFVDLAGSERLNTSDLVRKIETSNINKSLLCLGEVIKKLSKNQEHISYRDSKLTFFLRDSLAGSSKLAVIGTIHPGPKHTNDTINTLKFLSRVKLIKINPTPNSDIDMYGCLEELKNKIRILDAENQKLKVQSYLTDKEKSSRMEKKGKSPFESLSHGIFFEQVYKKIKLLEQISEDLKATMKDFSNLDYKRKIKILLEISRKQDLIIRKEKEKIIQMSLEEVPENK